MQQFNSEVARSDYRLSVMAVFVWLAVAVPGLKAQTSSPNPAAVKPVERGEFGADLGYLKKHYMPPQVSGESNYFLDLWEGQGFRGKVTSGILTNNRTLFVNSHGREISTRGGKRYALYPHESLLPPGEAVPHFSAGDLAALLGPADAAKIQNIVIGGCNAEGAFRSEEFHMYFPYATNIIHMPAGELGCQVMLLQCLMTESANVQPVFESAVTSAHGDKQFLLGHKSKHGAVQFRPYVADLYMPGSRKPFKTQTAGRELLDPSGAPLPAASADLVVILPQN